MSNPQYSDRAIALVTGGAKGIGEAISQRLAHDGFVVVVADLDSEAARETAERIVSSGLLAEPLTLNVADAASIAAAFEELDRRHGRCDVLINNAGVARTYPFLDFPLENWELTMSVNVTGAMLCGQAAARLMMRRKAGRIVNIASVSGMRASDGRTAYGTSKGAVIALTRQMAIELAPHGITANGIAPGPVDTPMTRVLHSQASRKQYGRAVPMARYGRPEEIAAAVAFMASDDSSYITGHVMPVDGGYLAAGLLAEA